MNESSEAPHHDKGSAEGVWVRGWVVQGGDGAAVLGGTGAGGPPVIHPRGGPLLCGEPGHVGHAVVAQNIAHLLARPANVLLALQSITVFHHLRIEAQDHDTCFA